MSVDLSLTVRQRVRAHPDEVFAAWTQPDLMSQWLRMGPDWSTTVPQADPRPNGHYAISMRTPGGDTISYTGIYLKLEQGRRIEMSWPAYGRYDMLTILWVRLDSPSAGLTDVELTHWGFKDPAVRDDHERGWQSVLKELEAAADRGVLSRASP